MITFFALTPLRGEKSPKRTSRKARCDGLPRSPRPDRSARARPLRQDKVRSRRKRRRNKRKRARSAPRSGNATRERRRFQKRRNRRRPPSLGGRVRKLGRVRGKQGKGRLRSHGRGMFDRISADRGKIRFSASNASTKRRILAVKIRKKVGATCCRRLSRRKTKVPKARRTERRARRSARSRRRLSRDRSDPRRR